MNTIVEDLTEIHHSTGRCQRVGRRVRSKRDFVPANQGLSGDNSAMQNVVPRIVGYTTGVFDLFHIGHLNILRRSAEACDHLIVGVSTDELVLEVKGHSPVIPFAERAEIVAAIKGVSAVVPEHDVDKLIAWEQHRFGRIFKGSDWKGSARWRNLEVEFARRGVDVVYFPYTTETSSTALRAALTVLSGRG